MCVTDDPMGQSPEPFSSRPSLSSEASDDVILLDCDFDNVNVLQSGGVSRTDEPMRQSPNLAFSRPSLTSEASNDIIFLGSDKVLQSGEMTRLSDSQHEPTVTFSKATTPELALRVSSRMEPPKVMATSLPKADNDPPSLSIVAVDIRKEIDEEIRKIASAGTSARAKVDKKNYRSDRSKNTSAKPLFSLDPSEKVSKTGTRRRSEEKSAKAVKKRSEQRSDKGDESRKPSTESDKHSSKSSANKTKSSDHSSSRKEEKRHSPESRHKKLEPKLDDNLIDVFASAVLRSRRHKNSIGDIGSVKIANVQEDFEEEIFENCLLDPK